MTTQISLADYRVISHNEDTPINKDIQFGVPKDAFLETATAAQPILMYTLHAEDPSDLSYQIEINGKLLATWSINANIRRTVHEVVSPSLLKRGQNDNTVRFQVTGGDGVLKVGQVVLWFQRNQ